MHVRGPKLSGWLVGLSLALAGVLFPIQLARTQAPDETELQTSADDGLGAPALSQGALPREDGADPSTPEAGTNRPGPQAEVNAVVAYAEPTAESDAALYPSPVEVPAGFRVHDGLFLRVSIGPGAGQSRYRERVNAPAVDDVRASGLSGQVEAMVGGSLTESLILHGNALFLGFSSPTRDVGGVKDAALEVSWNAWMVGAGLTHYFLPHNVYLTGSAGLAWLVERREQIGQVEASTGFALSLAAGKEWWVGRDGAWGLGAALRGLFWVAPLNVAGVASTLRGGDLALVFSATLN